MTKPPILNTTEKEAGFIKDWNDGMNIYPLMLKYGYGHRKSVYSAAKRLGLAPRDGGVNPGKLDTPEKVEAFKRDWELGMPLKEMAAMHGYNHEKSVSAAARKLGLEKRRGGAKQTVLRGGRWEFCPRRRVRVWVEA